MQPLGPAHLLNPKEAQKLNLSVLKRIDAATEQVLASANHVALYDFDQTDSRWIRKDVEGSLFLIQRNVVPFYQIIILNKKSQQNYVEDVTAGFQFEKSRPYLLYRNKRDEVVGIWFYEEEEADKVESLLHRILEAYPTAEDPTDGAHEQAPEQTPVQQAAAPQDDAFWDQRAPSPPSDFDPFASRAAAATPPSALGMMTPGPPAPPSAPAMSTTPPKSPGNFLRGVNGLKDGSMMTPEQSNLAKLLANMKMAPSGSGSVSTTVSTPTQAPSGSTQHSASTSDLLRPALLTPKFFKAQSPAPALARPNGSSSSISIGGPGDPSGGRSTVTDASTAQRASSDPLSAASLPQPEKQLLEDTSLSRFFPLASMAATSSSPGAAAPSAAAPPQPEAMPSSPAANQRERLRLAITTLAKSDAFLDILAKELSAAGLWR
ncbi:probable mRNA-decapping enzyme 1B at N-terminal half [Coccomyxa sp. Obi]|nr:probable mRNA-decapping enzyme 1B at N-terminal half [Coccomyxa sp. Obi]